MWLLVLFWFLLLGEMLVPSVGGDFVVVPADCAVRSTHLESTIHHPIRTLVSHRDPNRLQTENE